MIIMDYSGIAMGAYFARGSSKEEGILRHFILNSIRMHNLKFREKYGEVVIACDQSSWRKDYFPLYKANRRKNRDKSDVDWKEVFEIFSKIKREIKENFPYKVIDVQECEADDVIATLVKETQEFGKNEPVMIISSDKDFIQLHKYKNVEQWSPLTKKFINHEDPSRYLFDHICKGDSGDGVPNVLSRDDVLVSDTERQSPLTKKKINLWYDNLNDLQSVMRGEEYRNYQRNKTLIDFDKIPSPISESILETYNNYKKNNSSKVFNYLIENRLNQLIESVQEFL